MKLNRRMLGCALAATTALGLALPAAGQQATQALSSESVIERIKQDGVIRIGLSLFVPWSMRDRNGELIGYELDVGRKLAEDMGVEAEFVPTSWDGIIPALVAGNFDVIISGMSVTAQRNLTVNFTDPYAYSGLAILANRGDDGRHVAGGPELARRDLHGTPGRDPGRRDRRQVSRGAASPLRRGRRVLAGSAERQRPRDNGLPADAEP